ncbi:translation repressor [Syncephalis fuscata]|nr:translation repressor [Syncephalis fuscata]
MTETDPDKLLHDLAAQFVATEPTPLQAVLEQLEHEFLLPKPTLTGDWLKEAQIQIERPVNIDELVQLPLGRRSANLIWERDPVEGRVIGYTEARSSTEDGLTAQNSTSFQRDPAPPSEFVRGSTRHYPFTPGGIESSVLKRAVDNVAQEMLHVFAMGSKHDTEITGLETIMPGLSRGLILTDGVVIDATNITEKESTDISSTDLLNPMEIKEKKGFSMDDLFSDDITEFEINLQEKEEEEIVKENNENEIIEEKTEITKDKDKVEQLLDDMLPSKPLNVTLPTKRTITGKKDWAHIVNAHAVPIDFNDVVPELARDFSFELDTFQKQAVYHLEKGESVFVAAHTSAGKTVVAEYAIALAARHMTRAIYTSPIKALSNQKFRDFRATFDDVGILTGDVQIQPEASCLIMTTEILRSMLYRGADLIRDVEFVIFDEVHYVNDLEVGHLRGVVWEEVIIMLPAHVTLILLSATVPNTREFADWVGRTKKQDIYVISTLKRPVPLEHFIWAGNDIHRIVDEKRNFISQGWKNANDASKGLLMKGNQSTANRGGGRGGSTTIMRQHRGTVEKQDRNTWIHLVGFLNKKKLLPAVVFTFSKRKCEEYAGALTNLDLCTATEKSEIHVFIERSTMRLRGSDKELPQVLRMRELMSRGIAVHHGGLLPIIKEIVEILFARGLVKVLFATETFAMGVNMPARTVVFSGIRKHDGKSFRDLLPGEYTQMSGRAGRRGLDKTGKVIIATGLDIPETVTLNQMILGTPMKLESQFRLTYNMILNLLRVEALKVEEMIKYSFSENASQRELPEQQRLFAQSEKDLHALSKLDCTICLKDIYEYYDISSRVITLGYALQERIVFSPAGTKALSAGRIVLINNSQHRNAPAVILKTSGAGQITEPSVLTTKSTRSRAYWCLILTSKERLAGQQQERSEDGFAPVPVTSLFVPDPAEAEGAVQSVSFTDIGFITKQIIKLDVDLIMSKRGDAESTRVVQLLTRFAEETMAEKNLEENDWSKLRELDFQEKLQEKHRLMRQLITFQCCKCPDLDAHYASVHGERVLQTKIAELQRTISDQNLELLPDYEQRVQVLKILSYVDEHATVQLKGRVACEINSADELVLTELILENAFADDEPAEIVALLSGFIFHEKSDSPPQLTTRLEQGRAKIMKVAERVAEAQAQCGLPVSPDDYLHLFKFTLAEVVYEWARGMPFKQITELTDIQEGSIVRCITRLDETCREVRNAARIIGDSTLYNKMEEAAVLIKRDIVFAASLYF